MERLVDTNNIKDSDFFVDIYWLKNQMELNKDLIILDIPYGLHEYELNYDKNKRVYSEKHIPRAIEINKLEIENEDSDLNIFSAEKIEQVFLSKGITCESTVVVYSDGYNASGRIAFIAYWLGVKEVKILDGGFQAWEKSKFPIESGINKPIPADEFGIDVPLRPEILISTPDDVLYEQENNDNFVLASIRSWDEYIGNVSGYTWIDNAGSPLGSVYAECSSERVNTIGLLTDEGYIANPINTFKKWKEWGITKEKQVAFFCGSGWRATIPFFITKQLGWKRTQLYDGGWYQWLKYNKKNPEKYKVQEGNPKNKEEFKIK